MTETLEQQYETVKKDTTTSPVQRYGDLRMMNEPVSKFLGNNTTSFSSIFKDPCIVRNVLVHIKACIFRKS